MAREDVIPGVADVWSPRQKVKEYWLHHWENFFNVRFLKQKMVHLKHL